MRHLPKRTISLASAALAVSSLLASCLPAPLQDTRVDVAVIGAPANDLVPGAAEAVDAFLRAAEGPYDLVASSTLRFLEARRGLVGSQVAAGAAAIGRSTGGDVVVIVSASTLTRTLIDGDRREPVERLTLALDARLVSASDAQVLGVVASAPVLAERVLEEAVLPPLDDDPLLAWAIERVVTDDLGPALFAALDDSYLTSFTGRESSGE